MKTFLMILYLLLISSISYSQRPEVVDNSQYFPPVRSQQNVANCTNFALIYYLKSSIWNKKFNRDPKLEENQFSHSFIWNQNVSEINPMSGTTDAFHLMKYQGCASVADFPLDETSSSLKPDYKIREKALNFKSERFIHKPYHYEAYGNTFETDMERFINELKDSLINEKNFIILLRIYEEFITEMDSGEVYSYLEKYEDPALRLPTHMATIIGYSDTIKTLNGRGAFLVINSSDRLPIFYLDYQWFYKSSVYNTIWFLEENFTSKPELAFHLSLRESLKNVDIHKCEYFFVDTLRQKEGKLVDCISSTQYAFRHNLARIIKLNGRSIPIDSLEMAFPVGSDDGSYDVISDLTEIVSKDDFESVEIVVNDPISGEFSSDQDGVIYSYNRESEVEVVKSFVSIIGTDSIAVGEVTSLPDTTIVLNDFYSLQARNHVGRTLTEEEEMQGVYIKTAKSVLARKLITIRKEDFMGPLELLNVLDTLMVYQDSIANFQFQAKSQEGAVNYKLAMNNGGSINPTSGLFTFSAVYDRDIEEAEWYDFILEVKSGTYTVLDTFAVEVRPRVNKFPKFFFVQDSTYHYECVEDSTLEFQFYIHDPEMEPVTTGVYDLSEDEAGVSLITDGEHNNEYRFYYHAKEVGEFTVQIFFSDGYHTFTREINIVVRPYTNIKDRHKANFELVVYPNPVQDNVHFEFNLPQRGMINIEVYNLTGQLIETAVSDYFESGYNRATFNGSYLTPGTYLCRLRDENNTVQTIKIIKR